MAESRWTQRLLHREACPKCRAGGGDTRGDNLGVFADHHKHCFACGYHEFAPKWEQLNNLQRQQAIEAGVEFLEEDISKSREHIEEKTAFQKWGVRIVDLKLPLDAMPIGHCLGDKLALNWLKGYGVTDEEIKTHKMMWSQNHKMLIFPVLETINDITHGTKSELLMWQGRRFGSEPGPKYLTNGEKHDIMDLCGSPKAIRNVVIVTEDKLSAIKVGRLYESFPLWGAEMSLELIKKVSAKFDALGVWLDRDKEKEALLIALRASQFLPTFLITTAFDPKDYTEEMIQKEISAAAAGAMYRDEITQDLTCLVEPQPEPFISDDEDLELREMLYRGSLKRIAAEAEALKKRQPPTPEI